MKKDILKLNPVDLRVLNHIHDHGPILVPILSKELIIDRGRVEGSVATLLEKDLIDRDSNIITIHKLTERGNQANTGLIERLLIDKLQTPTHMKDLQQLEGVSRGDISAGIGILKKAKLIAIEKGTVSLSDANKASKFSMDLVDGLKDLSSGKDSVPEKVGLRLKERGFVEIIEKSEVTVTSKVDDKRLKNAVATEEVSKLTPEMLTSGSWKNVSFKPYAMNVKPRKIYAGRNHPYRQFLDHLKS